LEYSGSSFTVTPLIPTFLILITAAVVSTIIYYGLKRILLRSRLASSVREALATMVPLPLAVVVFGYGGLLALESLRSVYLGVLPYFATPAAFTILLELVTLAVTIRAVSVAVRHLKESVAEIRETEKLLMYGIYALSLIILFYIFLNSPVSPTVQADVWAMVNFLMGLVVTYLAAYISNVVMKRYTQAIQEEGTKLKTTITFARRLTLAAIALVGVSAATFSSFPAAGGLIASLFIAAGFSSIVIGLAAQSSLSNLVAGMVVSVSQPFEIGDAVVFRNEFCFVEDIRLMLTVLRTWDNRRLMIPNQLFLTEVVTNYTTKDPTMLAPVLVQISYESDVDKAMRIMTKVAREHPECMPIGNLPNVVVMDYTEAGISLRLLSRAKDQPTAFQMERDLLYSIRKEFLANGIAIAYPRREVVVKNGSPGDLKTVPRSVDT
jgi:small conductance mechanosensitive channel